MDKNTNIYIATAQYWMNRWIDALQQKDFEKARDYFKKANKWKSRARIDGMLQQICETDNFR